MAGVSNAASADGQLNRHTNFTAHGFCGCKQDVHHRRHPIRPATPHRPGHRRTCQHHHGLPRRLPQRDHRGPPRLHLRRRALRPAEEYRAPTDAEWEDFLGHFERRKLSVGTCARAYGTACIHEHACVRCSLLRPDPGQRDRVVEIRDNLIVRITEAEREGWLGEFEGLRASLAGAQNKINQIDASSLKHTVDVGLAARRR